MSKKSTQNIRIKESYAYLKGLHTGIDELITYNDFKIIWGTQVANLSRSGAQEYVKNISQYKIYTALHTISEVKNIKVGKMKSPQQFHFLAKRGADATAVYSRSRKIYGVSEAQAVMLYNWIKDIKQDLENSTKRQDFLRFVTGYNFDFSEEFEQNRFVSQINYHVTKEFNARTNAKEKRAEMEAVRKPLRKKYNVKKGEKQKDFLGRFSKEDYEAYVGAKTKYTDEELIERKKIREQLKADYTEVLENRQRREENTLYDFIMRTNLNQIKQLSKDDFGELMKLFHLMGFTNEDVNNFYSPKENVSVNWG